MLIRLIYAIAVALAGSLAVLAAFLPWVSVNVELPRVLELPILPITVELPATASSIGTVTQYGYEGDGIITLILGLLAVGSTAYLWIERNAVAFRLATLFNAFLGALIFAIALVNLSLSQRAMGDAQRQLGVDLEALVGIDLQSFVDTGAGIYVTIAAGAVLTVASLLAFSTHRFALAGPLASDLGSELGVPPRSCPGCRADLPGVASYCPNCGRSLRSSAGEGGSDDS